MKITKELLDAEIAKMDKRHNHYRALAEQTAGALVVLKDLRVYLDTPDPMPEQGISPENKKVQDALAQKMAAKDAISEDQLAEMVGGKGAKVEDISPISTVKQEIVNG